MEYRCVCCGEIIPEGRQVCPNCEMGVQKMLKPCPFCGGKAVAHPFLCQIAELPKPIKLFGRWSLIKMRYREIPVSYEVECANFCDGFAENGVLAIGKTQKEAVEEWNRRAEDAV